MDLFKATLSRKGGDAADKVPVKSSSADAGPKSCKQLNAGSYCVGRHDAEADQASNWSSRWYGLYCCCQESHSHKSVSQ